MNVNIFIIFILVFIYVIALIIHAYKSKFIYKHISCNEAYNNAVTGDIIYFIHNRYYNLASYFRPFIAHLGMVVVINNQKYIIEIHAKDDKKRLGVNKNGGINIYPFKWRVQSYHSGNIYLAKLLKHKIPSNELTTQFINKINYYQQTIPFNENFKLYGMKNCLIQRLCKNCFNIEEIPGMFCSEFIGFCLKELGIISLSHKCIFPDEFVFLKDQDNIQDLYNEFYHINE